VINITKKINNYFIIVTSFFIALALTFIDVPTWVDWVYPECLSIILLYWIYTSYTYVNIGSAFLVGVILDIVFDTPIGEHALVLILAAYVIIKFNAKIYALDFEKRLVIIFGVIFWCQFAPLLLQFYLGMTTVFWLSLTKIFVKTLSGTLLWLILSVLLNTKRGNNLEIRR
jgi:rod shape-determining protein MreD